jgi:hypothetical protein
MNFFIYLEARPLRDKRLCPRKMHINRRPESVGVLNILLHLDQIYSLRNKNVPGGLTCSKNGPTRTGHIQVDRHQPSDACQLISLKINGQRFPSNWDTNLRWTINGSYLKTYVKSKHGWDEATWNLIDFEFVKAYCTPTKSTGRYKWFKFMHNLQSVGERKQKMNRRAEDVNISMCPCCNQQMETQ